MGAPTIRSALVGSRCGCSSLYKAQWGQIGGVGWGWGRVGKGALQLGKGQLARGSSIGSSCDCSSLRGASAEGRANRGRAAAACRRQAQMEGAIGGRVFMYCARPGCVREREWHRQGRLTGAML